MIRPAQSASMRATNALTLTTAAQVWRNTKTSDGEGGHVSNWIISASTVCSREAVTRSQIETVIADRLTSTSYWAIELPVGTDVTAKDRVLTETRSFEVVAPVSDSYGLDLVLLCVEVL